MGSGASKPQDENGRQTTTANILNTGVSSSSGVALVSITDEPKLDRENRISKLFCQMATFDELTSMMSMKPHQWDQFIIHCFIDDDCVLRERVRNTLIFLIFPDRYPHMERTIQLPDFLDIVENEVFKEVVSRNAKIKFAELDVDKSGTLEAKEIKLLADWILEVEQSFSAPGKSDVKTLRANIMKRIDFSKDGQITFDEFCVLFEEVYRREEYIRRANAKFMELDTEGAGHLKGSQLEKVVDWMLELEQRTFLDPREKKKVRKHIMRAVDGNKDGKLSQSEFTQLCEMEFKMLELKKKATDKFREIDGNGSGFLANDELDKLVTYINGVCFDFFNARKALLEKYDKDHDGKINLEEFLCIMDDISHADSDVVQTSIGPSNNATVRKVKTHRTTTTDNSASSTPRGGLEASLKSGATSSMTSLDPGSKVNTPKSSLPLPDDLSKVNSAKGHGHASPTKGGMRTSQDLGENSEWAGLREDEGKPSRTRAAAKELAALVANGGPAPEKDYQPNDKGLDHKKKKDSVSHGGFSLVSPKSPTSSDHGVSPPKTPKTPKQKTKG